MLGFDRYFRYTKKELSQIQNIMTKLVCKREIPDIYSIDGI